MLELLTRQWACRSEMAEVLLFHHAQGQTAGFHAFADELRQAGHTVHTPDLFGGRTFGTIDEGLAYAEEVGFGEIIERGVRERGCFIEASPGRERVTTANGEPVRPTLGKPASAAKDCGPRSRLAELTVSP